MERVQLSTAFPIGSLLPNFRLKNIDGQYFDSSTVTINKGLLVVFTCNHCPYVKGSEAMLVDLARRYAGEGLATVTISSNDPTKYPEDSYELMQAKSASMQLPYPYLYDETQEVAKAFDAACTPECYLFNAQRKLVYHGAVNDSPKNAAAVKSLHIGRAVEQLLAGAAVEPNFVHPIGCSIKWR